MKLAAGLWCTKTWLGLGGCCCCCCCKAAAAGSWGWKYTLMGCWGWPGCTAEGWTCDCTGWPAEETPWLTTVPVAAETVGGICIWGWGGCPMWWAGGAWWWWWWWCPTRGWYWGCWEGGGACKGCCAGVGPGGGCIFFWLSLFYSSTFSRVFKELISLLLFFQPFWLWILKARPLNLEGFSS